MKIFEAIRTAALVLLASSVAWVAVHGVNLTPTPHFFPQGHCIMYFDQATKAARVASNTIDSGEATIVVDRAARTAIAWAQIAIASGCGVP